MTGRPPKPELPLTAEDRAVALEALSGLGDVIRLRERLLKRVADAARATQSALERLVDVDHPADLPHLLFLSTGEVPVVLDVIGLSATVALPVEEAFVAPPALRLDDCLRLCGLAQQAATAARRNGEDTWKSAMLRTYAEEVASAFAELDLVDSDLVELWRTPKRRAAVTSICARATRVSTIAANVRACEGFALAGGIGSIGKDFLRAKANEPFVPQDEKAQAMHAHGVFLVAAVARARHTSKREARALILDACQDARVLTQLDSTATHGGRRAAGHALAGLLFPVTDGTPNGVSWARKHKLRLSELSDSYLAAALEFASGSSPHEKTP